MVVRTSRLTLIRAELPSGDDKVPASSENRQPHKEPGHSNEEGLQDAIRKAEHDAMEARAAYVLRNKIIENVVIADPVLKAVHGGRDETFADR